MNLRPVVMTKYQFSVLLARIPLKQRIVARYEETDFKYADGVIFAKDMGGDNWQLDADLHKLIPPRKFYQYGVDPYTPYSEQELWDLFGELPEGKERNMEMMTKEQANAVKLMRTAKAMQATAAQMERNARDAFEKAFPQGDATPDDCPFYWQKRTVYKCADPETLDPKFQKTTISLDTDKAKAYHKLEGELPEGIWTEDSFALCAKKNSNK